MSALHGLDLIRRQGVGPVLMEAGGSTCPILFYLPCLSWSLIPPWLVTAPMIPEPSTVSWAFMCNVSPCPYLRAPSGAWVPWGLSHPLVCPWWLVPSLVVPQQVFRSPLWDEWVVGGFMRLKTGCRGVLRWNFRLELKREMIKDIFQSPLGLVRYFSYSFHSFSIYLYIYIYMISFSLSLYQYLSISIHSSTHLSIYLVYLYLSVEESLRYLLSGPL